jgi:hypothetical protein
MQLLADTLNPETSYVVTGGTNYGAERTMHEAVHRRNQEAESKLLVLGAFSKLMLLGTFTMEAALEGEEGIEKDTITHAIVLRSEVTKKKAKTWKDLPDTQLDFVIKRDGHMIAIGGGSIVSDMIQRAHNLGVDMHLMDGPEGASTDKSKALRGNDYSFVTPEDLIRRLYSRNPELFLPDFTLEKLDEYLARAREQVGSTEIPNNPANFGLGAISEIDKLVTAILRNTGKEKLEGEIASESKDVDDPEVKPEGSEVTE